MNMQQWVVAQPSEGRYSPRCFRLEEAPMGSPAVGQLFVQTKLLSLDPTHLNWVKVDPALQYLPIGVGDAMIGTNIGIVLESGHPDFSPGQHIIGTWGWGRTAIADASMVRLALPESEMSFENQLTIMSHVGQAAAGGMLKIGAVTSGDAVLVSGAAGATGSIAAQIAKAFGCRTVGIAGGPEKCRYLVEELGLDGAIDYRAGGVEAAIAKHFPNGVDLFFDNVGGPTLDAVLANMAQRCRIVICGAIAQYDEAGMSNFGGIHRLPMLIFRQARMEGYVASQFGEAENAEILEHLLRLHQVGKLRVRTHIVSFEQIPDALTMLLDGRNEGKLIARVD